VIHPPKGSTYFYNKNGDDVPSENGWMKTNLCDPKDDIRVVVEKEKPDPPRRKWRSGGGVRWKRGGNKTSPQNQRLASLQAKLKKKKTPSPPEPPTEPEPETEPETVKPKRKWKPGSTISWSRKKNTDLNEKMRTLQSKRSARFQVTQSWKQRIENSPKKKKRNSKSPSKRVRFVEDKVDEEEEKQASSPRVHFDIAPKKKPIVPPRQRRSTPHFKRNQKLLVPSSDEDFDDDDDLPIRVPRKAVGFAEEMPETKVPPVKQDPEMVQRSIDFLSGKSTSSRSAPLPKEMDLEECLRAVRLAIADLRALRDEVQAQ
jgi:hypothetical protein